MKAPEAGGPLPSHSPRDLEGGSRQPTATTGWREGAALLLRRRAGARRVARARGPGAGVFTVPTTAPWGLPPCPPDGDRGALSERQQVASARGRARVLSCVPRPCCPGPGPRCPRCVPLNSAKLSRTGEPRPRTCPPRPQGCWARPPACQGRRPMPRNRLLTACGLCCPERMWNIFPVIWVHLLPLSTRGVEAGGPGLCGLVTCLHPAEGPKRRALQSVPRGTSSLLPFAPRKHCLRPPSTLRESLHPELWGSRPGRPLGLIPRQLTLASWPSRKSHYLFPLHLDVTS